MEQLKKSGTTSDKEKEKEKVWSNKSHEESSIGSKRSATNELDESIQGKDSDQQERRKSPRRCVNDNLDKQGIAGNNSNSIAF